MTPDLVREGREIVLSRPTDHPYLSGLACLPLVFVDSAADWRSPRNWTLCAVSVALLGAAIVEMARQRRWAERRTRWLRAVEAAMRIAGVCLAALLVGCGPGAAFTSASMAAAAADAMPGPVEALDAMTSPDEDLVRSDAGEREASPAIADAGTMADAAPSAAIDAAPSTEAEAAADGDAPEVSAPPACVPASCPSCPEHLTVCCAGDRCGCQVSSVLLCQATGDGGA